MRMYNVSHRLFERFVRHYSKSLNPKILVERIKTRNLLKVKGNTASEFLQGLITNDMRHIDEGSPCMFAMFLNAKGRILYDSLVYKGDNQDEYLIECDSGIIKDLDAHLKIYKVRRKLLIEDLSEQYSVWTANITTSSEDIKPLASRIRNLKSVVDPRTTSLGIRIILPCTQDLAPLLQEQEFDVTEEEFYQSLRYKLGIGEGANELPTGNCFPLEANGDYMHGVSFHKGCYIGQELTARTHHTGVVRKRLMPLKALSTDVKLNYDSPVLGDAGKNVGKVRGSIGNVGLALLRVEDVLKAESLEVEGQKCETARPSWWPKEAPKTKAK